MAAAELCGRAIVGKTAGVVKFFHRAVFFAHAKKHPCKISKFR